MGQEGRKGSRADGRPLEKRNVGWKRRSGGIFTGDATLTIQYRPCRRVFLSSVRTLGSGCRGDTVAYMQCSHIYE
jgi:hypothetical protein